MDWIINGKKSHKNLDYGLYNFSRKREEKPQELGLWIIQFLEKASACHQFVFCSRISPSEDSQRKSVNGETSSPLSSIIFITSAPQTPKRSRDRMKLPQSSHTDEGLVVIEDIHETEENQVVDEVEASKNIMTKRKKPADESDKKRAVIIEKKTKSTKSQQQDVKSFYGYKCYLDQLIEEVNRIGSLMDGKTMKLLMETPFSGFFSAILERKITADMVQRCTKSITSIIHMYTGEGVGFQLSEKGEAADLKVTDVACILGIRMGEETFDTHEKVLGKRGIFEERYFKVQRISRRGLGDEMSKLLGKKRLSDEERLDVVRMLILYSFATFFFANTSGSVAKAIVKKFDDLPYVNKCCWPSMIHQHMMESIQKHHKSTEPNVSGCVYILLYFFLEHTTLHNPIKGREMSEPRMTKWNLKQVTGTNWENTLDRLSQQELGAWMILLSEGERELIKSKDGVRKLEVTKEEKGCRKEGMESIEEGESDEEGKTVEADVDLNFPHENDTAVSLDTFVDQVVSQVDKYIRKSDNKVLEDSNVEKNDSDDEYFQTSDFNVMEDSNVEKIDKDGDEEFKFKVVVNAPKELEVDRERRSKRFQEMKRDKSEKSKSLEETIGNKIDRVEKAVTKSWTGQANMKEDHEEMVKYWEDTCNILRKENDLLRKKMEHTEKRAEKDKKICETKARQIANDLADLNIDYDSLVEISQELKSALGDATILTENLMKENSKYKSQTFKCPTVEIGTQTDLENLWNTRGVEEGDKQIKDLIVHAWSYRSQLKERDEELKKAKEIAESLVKQLDIERCEKLNTEKLLNSEKSKSSTLAEERVRFERMMDKLMGEREGTLEKLKEEIQNLRSEHERTSILADENATLKVEINVLNKQVEGLNKFVNDLNRAAVVDTSATVHDATPLKSVKQTDVITEKTEARGRGRPKRAANVDEIKKAENVEGVKRVYKRKVKDVEPSSLTRRVKGRSRKESQRGKDFVYNKTSKEEAGKMIHPSNSNFWDLFSEEIKGKLIHLQNTAERSTIVWETEDSAGKLFLTAVLVEDLYMGDMISTDLLDWFFRWRIPNLSNKYNDIRETQMTGCFALRAGCYTQWKSDDTAETGFEMIKQDIRMKMNPCTYQSAMFVPMLVSECHWIILILDIDLMQWYVYNSITVANFELDEGTLAANLFRMHLQKVLLPKIRNLRRDPTLIFQNDILQEHGPIQQNGYDCGLFICKYVEHRILGASYIWGQKEIGDLRVEFISNIMSAGGNGWNQQLLLEGGNK